MENGILLCYGKIGIYKNRTPLEIEGEWNEEYFEISKCNLPKDNIRTVLSYLEVSQMNINTFERYRKGEDIITFLSSDKAKEILKDKYPEVSSLYESEQISEWLMKYEIPADRIETIISKGISLDEIKAHPYKTLYYAGVSVYLIDMLAKDIGFEVYHNERIEVWIIAAVQMYINSGNTIIEINELVKKLNKYFQKSTYESTVISRSIVLTKALKSKQLCIEYKGKDMYISLQHIQDEEEIIIQNVKRLNGNKQLALVN